MRKVEQVWEIITNTYERLHNIPKHIIEYVAVYDAMLLAVSGKSNDDIAKNLGVGAEYVSIDCVEFLGFEGWKDTLDINPIFVYNSVNGDRDKFVGRCSIDSNIMSLNDIAEAYSICKKFKEMEKEIDEHYY